MSLELDALPENVELTIPQPKATEVYYRTCGVIDQHNRHHQDNLKTEKKLETKKWDMRVNLTIFPTDGGALLGSADGDSTTTEVSTQPTATLPTLEVPSNTNTSVEQPTVVVAMATPPLTTENNNTVIANNDTPLPEAAATVHKQEWFVDDPATKLPVNGNYHSHNWAVKTRMGYMLGRGGDNQNSYSRLEYFLMLFPPQQLQLILQLTNNELAIARKNYTMAGEIVKFFGVMLLVTRFEFGSRASLWSNVTTNKYIPAPSFGLTGMPRKRFDDLWMCIRFSEQPPNRPSDMTSEQYRWRLVDDFVKNFNEHRAQNFSHLMKFASTSPCPSGMGKAGIGSTMACQCMLQSIGNRKMVVRSRMLPAFWSNDMIENCQDS